MMLDVTDRLAVIVGGGAVASRKATGLLDAGAGNVRVIAPQFDPSMPDAVERIASVYQPSQLDGADLVFAATDDPRVNEQVVRDARARRAWVCRADVDEDAPGDFITPAKFQSGGVTLLVSAGSPALAVLIRNQLAHCFKPQWSELASIMAQLRPRLVNSPLPIERRRAVFRDLASEESVDRLAASGETGLLDWLRARHADLQGVI